MDWVSFFVRVLYRLQCVSIFFYYSFNLIKIQMWHPEKIDLMPKMNAAPEPYQSSYECSDATLCVFGFAKAVLSPHLIHPTPGVNWT